MKVSISYSGRVPPVIAKDVHVRKMRDGLWFIQVTPNQKYGYEVDIDFGGVYTSTTGFDDLVLYCLPNNVVRKLRSNTTEITFRAGKEDKKDGLRILTLSNKRGWLNAVIMANRLMKNVDRTKGALPIKIKRTKS